jgi:hypothetical protein
MKPQTIHYALISTGAIALLISIAAGLQFYVSLGYSTGGMIIYGFAGVLIAVACAFMLPIVIGLFQHGYVLSGVFFAFVWIGLSVLQIYSEFGFFAKEQSNAENARAVSSDAYKSIKQRYDSVAQFSGLSVDALNAQKVSLEKQIASLEESYASYSDKYKSKRKQITDQINVQREKLANVQANIANAQNYATAKVEFESAAKPTGNTSKMGEYLHAAYQWGETLTGIKAHTLQVWTSVCIAIFLELWASAAAFLTMKLFGGNDHQHQWQAYQQHLDRKHEQTYVISGERGDNQGIDFFKPITKKANALKEANDYIANDVGKIKKAVGGIYQCESCGSDYTARTVWQKFCPVCSAERKAGVLKSKAKKANA